jgi:hypothetical protein
MSRRENSESPKKSPETWLPAEACTSQSACINKLEGRLREAKDSPPTKEKDGYVDRGSTFGTDKLRDRPLFGR